MLHDCLTTSVVLQQWSIKSMDIYNSQQVCYCLDLCKAATHTHVHGMM